VFRFKTKGTGDRGSVLVEFVLSLIAFLLFAYGLVAISLWGIAGEFVQHAAHEAAGVYAAILDEDRARERVDLVLVRWGYVFVDPESVKVSFSHDRENVSVVVSAAPRVRKLYVFDLGRVEKKSSCALECRFRPGGCGI
jgi:hypothetical protein